MNAEFEIDDGDEKILREGKFDWEQKYETFD